MSTATAAPRIPAELFPTGTSVAVRLPLEAGAVAHRPKRDHQEVTVGWRKGTKEPITVPACAPDEDPCAEVSAHWADHLGAQACTETACFPDATPR